jgi:hypothetical protein
VYLLRLQPRIDQESAWIPAEGVSSFLRDELTSVALVVADDHCIEYEFVSGDSLEMGVLRDADVINLHGVPQKWRSVGLPAGIHDDLL